MVVARNDTAAESASAQTVGGATARPLLRALVALLVLLAAVVLSYAAALGLAGTDPSVPL